MLNYSHIPSTINSQLISNFTKTCLTSVNIEIQYRILFQSFYLKTHKQEFKSQEKINFIVGYRVEIKTNIIKKHMP